MNSELYYFNLKDTISSFRYIPKVFKLLWNVNKLQFTLVSIINIINGIIPVISILTTQFLLNSIQTSYNKSLDYILYPLLIYIISNLIVYLIQHLGTYLESIFTQKLNYQLDIMILNKVNTLNLEDFENSDIYDSLRRAQSEGIKSIYSSFSTILSIISHILGLVASLIILSFWNGYLVIIISIVPIMSTFFMTKIAHLSYKIEFERSSKRRQAWYLSYLLSNDIAFKEIKIYKLGDYFLRKYKEINKSIIKQDKKLIQLRIVTIFIFELADQIIGGVVLFFIAKSAYLGNILLGDMIAYIRSLSNIKSNLQSVLGSISNIYKNNLHIKQFFDFLEMPVKKLQHITEPLYIDKLNTIEFKDVSFKYQNTDKYVLKNISFKINRGEKVAFVGENGSGKTTLIKLITGFYYDYEGEILINQISLRNIDRNILFDKIAVVFQDFNRYQLTCRENITLGNVDLNIDNSKVQNLLDKVNLKQMVQNLPNGIDTQLGTWFNEGVELSGGQWQRIALARSFFKNAELYIFDELSSSLDTISEYEIYKYASNLSEDKISVFTSHRLYNLKKINPNIIVLKNGELIEKGTHDELIRFKGHYSYLYNLQNKNSFN